MFDQLSTMFDQHSTLRRRQILLLFQLSLLSLIFWHLLFCLMCQMSNCIRRVIKTLLYASAYIDNFNFPITKHDRTFAEYYVNYENVNYNRIGKCIKIGKLKIDC